MNEYSSDQRACCWLLLGFNKGLARRLVSVLEAPIDDTVELGWIATYQRQHVDARGSRTKEEDGEVQAADRKLRVCG